MKIYLVVTSGSEKLKWTADLAALWRSRLFAASSSRSPTRPFC
ncbi:MAG TPA: hypothetical protein VK203_00345 [Nostocaceae cyanobacterium]|nr:hypothetical protein [Nostocaceae cyanobacterium]